MRAGLVATGPAPHGTMLRCGWPGPMSRVNGMVRADRGAHLERIFMNLSGGFPVDLVLFGLIAAFLVLRLRSILGRRTGFERPAAPVQPTPLRKPAGPVIE